MEARSPQKVHNPISPMDELIRTTLTTAAPRRARRRGGRLTRFRKKTGKFSGLGRMHLGPESAKHYYLGLIPTDGGGYAQRAVDREAR